MVCLKACRDRGRSYPIPNSPPGYIPRSPAPLFLLAWLAPGWANLYGNSSSSAFSHSKNTLVILAKKRLSCCCRISSRLASSSNSNRSSSYSSRFSPSRAPPYSSAAFSAAGFRRASAPHELGHHLPHALHHRLCLLLLHHQLELAPQLLNSFLGSCSCEDILGSWCQSSNVSRH